MVDCLARLRWLMNKHGDGFCTRFAREHHTLYGQHQETNDSVADV